MRTEWNSRWLFLVNGKVLFSDMQKEFQINCSIEDFQNNVIKEMIINKSVEIDQMRVIINPILSQKEI